MGVDLFRAPPPDASAGFMSVRYLQSGKLSTIQHIHLNTVVAATVATEFTNLANILKLFYNSAWKVQLVGLTQVVGGSLRRIATPVDPGTGTFYEETGTSTATNSDVEGYIQEIFNFDTADGNRGRVRLMGITGTNIQADAMVAADAAGTEEEKLVNYLVNTSTHIIARDGSKFQLPCHATWALVASERREAMRV